MSQYSWFTVYVAPFVGAWIETPGIPVETSRLIVAPFVGAWIETCHCNRLFVRDQVAPFVGAWIETSDNNKGICDRSGRSLRGSVD